MDKCKSDKYCPAICDYCIHYDFGGKVIKEWPDVYVGHGWCFWHQEEKDPDDDCDDFYCENLIYEDKTEG